MWYTYIYSNSLNGCIDEANCILSLSNCLNVNLNQFVYSEICTLDNLKEKQRDKSPQGPPKCNVCVYGSSYKQQM